MDVDWSELLGWDEEKVDEIRFFGFSLLREGRYEEARLFFETLLVLDKKSLFDRQTLGALYLQINENEKALKHLDIALSIDSADEPTLMNKAKALLMLDRKTEALEIIQNLKKSSNPELANDAEALILAHA